LAPTQTLVESKDSIKPALGAATCVAGRVLAISMPSALQRLLECGPPAREF